LGWTPIWMDPEFFLGSLARFRSRWLCAVPDPQIFCWVLGFQPFPVPDHSHSNSNWNGTTST
jgi:hypothetical protein